jgi:hypothetical protein
MLTLSIANVLGGVSLFVHGASDKYDGFKSPQAAMVFGALMVGFGMSIFLDRGR